MFDNDLELDIEQELSEIPPEYQELFRQTIEQELAETEQNRTDSDILAYLRRRREDFKRGSFIRPDGRPGLVALNPEAMYEQALPELARNSLGEPDSTAERRRTLVKAGVFVAVALLFLFFVFRGRARRAGEEGSVAEETPAAELSAEGTAVPTPPLPEITGVDDSLQTIGSLGGALTIGRPSAIELTYGRTEETIALPIDPSKPTPKGEMRYNEATMLSDNPVAVWLFGTVLNYAIGVPESMARNLEPGDRIRLSTDTGASLRFVVAETQQGANYEAGRLLSQNRLGLTLFALPSVAEDDVSFVLANYDLDSEETTAPALYDLGERVPLADDARLQVTAVQFSDTADGDIRIVVGGIAQHIPGGRSILLSLAAGGEQTTAVPLTPGSGGVWQASLTLPDSIAGLPLMAEFRLLPDGRLAVVQLGDAPRLREQVEVEIAGAWRDAEQDQVVVELSVTNPGEGAVYLDAGFIQMIIEGGDADEMTGQMVPRLPLLLDPGETAVITVSFLPHIAPVQLQIDADLWEIGG
jgi:hypothetical protein